LGGQLASLGIGGQTNGSFYATEHILIGNGSDAIGSANVLVSTNGLLCVTNATQNAFIELGASGTLTLDGGTLQVDSLVLTNGGTFTNVSGTLICPKPYQLENNSSLSINGGVLTTATNFTLGTFGGSTGTLTIADGGFISVSNSVLGIGNNGTTTNGAGVGQVTIANATLNASTITMGSTSGGLGTLDIQSNAFVSVASNLTLVSGSLSSTSSVTVVGGTLSVLSGTVAVGSAGSGQLTIGSGGKLFGQTIRLGGPTGSASGNLFVQSGGHLSFHFLSANQLAVPGGDADGNGGTIIIGDDHPASMTVSGDGTVTNIGTLIVGLNYTGTFLQEDDSTVVVLTNMIVGDCDRSVVGSPTVNGGTLYVTNESHTAMLIVSNGTLVLNPPGRLVVDTLVLTNPCAQLVNNAGPGALQVLVGTQLAPNLSAAGDGIPNGWKQQYGFDPFDPSVAGEDPDHDGMNNLAEYLAGTDPLDPESNFRITAVAVVNKTNLRVDWTTVGGHSYVVQTNPVLSTGTFHDLSPVIPVPGQNPGTASYVHIGGATNHTDFYRVRLGP
jgi:hypothetical protein